MPAPAFLINGGAEFMNRQRSIFDILSVVEKKTSLPETSNDDLMEIDYKQTRNNKRKRTKRFRGKESIFKIPMDLPPRFRKPQEINLRGKRWIRYSLADVSDYDLSNEGNTAAALSFLKSLQERKAGVEEEKISVNEKHLFKPSTINNEMKEIEESTTNKPVFKNSKLIMPEYVVGQCKKMKKNPVRNVSAEKKKEVYLDHIHEKDEEE